MGQILHGSATTTEAIRRAIQNSEASLRALSARYGINQKTVAKWRKRTSVADLPTGPKGDQSGPSKGRLAFRTPKFRGRVRIPTYPAGHSDNIWSAIPEYPAT